MNLGHSATNAALWSSLENILAQALSLAVFVVLARLLDPAAFGLVALSMAFIAILSAIGDLGLEQSIVQLPTLRSASLAAALLLAMAAHALLAALLFAAASPLALVTGEAQLQPVLQVLSFILLLRGASVVPRGLMSRRFQFRRLALRSILGIGSGGLVGVCMALAGYGVWALVGQELTRACVAMLVLWAGTEWKPRLPNVTALPELLRSSISLMGIRITRIVDNSFGNLAIGAVLGAATLGMYTIASKIQRVLSRIFLESLSRVGLSTFARLQSKPLRQVEAFLLATRIACAISLPVFLLVALNAGPLLLLVLGPQWVPAAPILKGLMAASCAACVSSFCAPLLIAVGAARIALRLALLNTATAILVILAFLQWGVTAVAAALAVRAWLLLPLGLWLCEKHAGIHSRQLLRGLAPHAASLLVMAAVMFSMQRATGASMEWFGLLIPVLAAALAYLLTLQLLDGPLLRQIKALPGRALQRAAS